MISGVATKKKPAAKSASKSSKIISHTVTKKVAKSSHANEAAEMLRKLQVKAHKGTCPYC